MHKTARYQRGITGLGWLTILIVIGFFVFLGLQIGPIYMEHYSIKSVLHSMKADTSLDKLTARQLRTRIKHRLKINSVYDFDQKNIKIKKRPDAFEINMSYEVRKPMVYNIAVVVSFKENVEIPIKR